MSQFSFTDTSHIPFTARVVDTGDRYGLKGCLVNEGEPMIEFYDARYPHTQWGQFISRYYLSTFMSHRGDLNLEGSVPDWTISGRSVRDVQDWVEGAPKHA